MICVTAPVAARVLAKSGARRAPARSAPRQARVSPRVSPIASRGVTLRVSASEDSSSSSSVETRHPPASKPSPTPAPSAGKPGQGKPPINPAFLAAGDFSAALLIAVIARGVAGQDIVSAGTAFAAAPFVVGWVGAGFLAGDYDSDSPNAALWGDAPRAMTTGALTWFSGSAFAILLRNVEGSVMIVAPALDEKVAFAGGLGLICAFRALVAATKPGVEK
jgi:hypothetical protein